MRLFSMTPYLINHVIIFYDAIVDKSCDYFPWRHIWSIMWLFSMTPYLINHVIIFHDAIFDKPCDYFHVVVGAILENQCVYLNCVCICHIWKPMQFQLIIFCLKKIGKTVQLFSLSLQLLYTCTVYKKYNLFRAVAALL